jgi:hypothetical protein
LLVDILEAAHNAGYSPRLIIFHLLIRECWFDPMAVYLRSSILRQYRASKTKQFLEEEKEEGNSNCIVAPSLRSSIIFFPGAYTAGTNY